MTKLIPEFILLLIFVVSNFVANGEGTAQLRPVQSNTGSLHLSNNNIFTKFGQYGAPVAQQIKIRIGAAGEKIYFGFNNHLEDGTAFIPSIPYRILSPSGAVVFNSIMPPPGQPGHINTWAQAVAGPMSLGNANGYDALNINTLEVGDYVIEFDITSINNEQLQIDLFDITVAGSDMKVKRGRLHSQSWQISTEKSSNPFYGKVYPYNVKGVVYEVDFNQMQPYTFVIFFNSKGTSNTGNTVADRQSKVKFNTFPEYEVFLNKPDSFFYPAKKKIITFKSTPGSTDCSSRDFCLNFSSNEEGILDGYIDVNGNAAEDANDVRFSQQFTEAGTKCIPWDGKDSKGADVDFSKIKIYSTFGYGVTHLPLFDVEDNVNGFKVRIVSPIDSAVQLFWDDSRLSSGTAIDGKTNLDGCKTAIGCHRWRNRGDNSNPESINTWWYTTLSYDTLVLDAPQNAPVHISFDSNTVKNNDTLVCKGEKLSIYILKDSSHYNSVKFNYSWILNSVILPGNEKELIKNYNENSIVVLKSALKSNPDCFSVDTLKVKIVPPVKISAKVTQGDCLNPTGTIEATILSGPPGATFSWKQFPANKTGTLKQLVNGVYNLHVQDPAFSARCALDTVFTIKRKASDSIAADFIFKTQANSNPILEGDIVQFTNLTPPPFSASAWELGDGGTSSSKNPSHRYDSAGTYAVSLTIMGASGCPGKMVKVITIAKSVTIAERTPCEATLPNAFSPNGDGVNEDIGILGKVVSMDLIIFNRWGETIFRSDEKQLRWHGKYRLEEAPIGVYPYLLTYECPDQKGELIKRLQVGEITLVR